MKRHEPETVDDRLRARLEPDPEAARRIARAALASDVGARARRRLLARRFAMAAALVAVAWLGGTLLGRREPAPRVPSTGTLQIANFGEVMTVVDPSGSIWIGGVSRRVEPTAPRLIIRLGGNHVR